MKIKFRQQNDSRVEEKLKTVLGNNEDDLDLRGTDFRTYLNSIIHDWLKVLTAFVFILVPLFFLLDYFFMVPKEFILRVGIYRLISTLIALAQFFIVRRSKPGLGTYLHGYIVTINVGAVIALMTILLGGFNSRYYAGLNLLIIGVNLLLPWKAIHSSVNCLLVILMYVSFNFIAAQPFDPGILANNLFFLTATAIVSVSINHVKHTLVHKEFSLLVKLRKARDALWSEMELAKRIQTALLPERTKISGYEIAAAMYPTKEVGGDYYDIIETASKDRWVSMGDVSGHGVDSGLIMMMAQTSIISMVNSCGICRPSAILEAVNKAMRENLTRLGSEHYMTLMLMRLEDHGMIVAGKHQDLIIFRYEENRTEVIPTEGTWLGIINNVRGYLRDQTVRLNGGDIVVLFTDGITEATNKEGELFGQLRIEQLLNQYADLPPNRLLQKIIDTVMEFQVDQMDDMTLVVLKKTGEF